MPVAETVINSRADFDQGIDDEPDDAAQQESQEGKEWTAHLDVPLLLECSADTHPRVTHIYLPLAQGLLIVAQDLHLVAQDLHLIAQDLHLVAQDLHLVAQDLHLVALDLLLGTQDLHAHVLHQLIDMSINHLHMLLPLAYSLLVILHLSQANPQITYSPSPRTLLHLIMQRHPLSVLVLPVSHLSQIHTAARRHERSNQSKGTP
ncbi:hypothetical protein BDR06DRAFT_1010638 [Suillus hirtellus]|nr:hypothetical protein BDR06DRAFT_1010638 [Suillus hirtellus]